MKLKQLWYGIANAAFLLFWVALDVRVFRHWHTMSGNSHFWVSSMAVMFPMLWLCLLREKTSLTSLALTNVIIWAAMRAAFPS
jgi:hypothetical protein